MRQAQLSIWNRNIATAAILVFVIVFIIGRVPCTFTWSMLLLLFGSFSAIGSVCTSLKRAHPSPAPISPAFTRSFILSCSTLLRTLSSSVFLFAPTSVTHREQAYVTPLRIHPLIKPRRHPCGMGNILIFSALIFFFFRFYIPAFFNFYLVSFLVFTVCSLLLQYQHTGRTRSIYLHNAYYYIILCCSWIAKM